jgi:hypothetical protein
MAEVPGQAAQQVPHTNCFVDSKPFANSFCRLGAQIHATKSPQGVTTGAYLLLSLQFVSHMTKLTFLAV